MSINLSDSVVDQQQHQAESIVTLESYPSLEQTDAAEMGRLRREIDDLNVKLLRLIESRGRIALQIMDIKRRNLLPTHDPIREEVMLRRLIAQSGGIYGSDGIREFYRSLFRLSVDTMNEWEPAGASMLTGTTDR